MVTVLHKMVESRQMSGYKGFSVAERMAEINKCEEKRVQNINNGEQ